MVSDNEANKKRTVKACDRCRLKKVKCDGHVPCLRCQQGDAICHFGVSISSEGKSVSAAHVNQLQVHNEILVKALRTMWNRYGDATDKKASIHDIVQSLDVLGDQAHLFMDPDDAGDSFSGYEQSSGGQSVASSEHTYKPFSDTASAVDFDMKNPDLKNLTSPTYLNAGMDYSNTTTSYAESSTFDQVPALTDDDSPSDKTSRSSISSQGFHNNNGNNNIMHTLTPLEPLHEEQKQRSWPSRPKRSSLHRPNRPKDKLTMPRTYQDELMHHQYSLQHTPQHPLGFPNNGNSSYDSSFTPAEYMSNSPAGLDFDTCMNMGDINNDTLHWYQQG